MKIAVIGHGNVGGALAKGWSKHGHNVTIGARSTDDEKLKEYANVVAISSIKDAVTEADVVLLAIPGPAVPDLARSLEGAGDKVIIDATNSVFMKEKEYPTGAHALKAITGAEHVVKGFNTTGFENMTDPIYDGKGIDMFTAGDSEKGKEIVKQLALDLGFSDCYDFGGDEKFELIEHFAMAWINLALIQGEGRDIAFKVLRR